MILRKTSGLPGLILVYKILLVKTALSSKKFKAKRLNLKTKASCVLKTAKKAIAL